MCYIYLCISYENKAIVLMYVYAIWPRVAIYPWCRLPKRCKNDIPFRYKYTNICNMTLSKQTWHYSKPVNQSNIDQSDWKNKSLNVLLLHYRNIWCIQFNPVNQNPQYFILETDQYVCDRTKGLIWTKQRLLYCY